MKKLISFILAAASILIFSVPSITAASGSNAVYGETVNDGTYKIEVTSSSSMFKIIDCELTVSGGKMTAVMTLSGKGYEKLFMGTGEQALSASEAEYVYFTENAEGKYTYKIPVEALDKELDCAAWSIKKQKWYDRKIMFLSGTLPDGAVKNSFEPVYIIIAAVIIAAAASAAVIKRKRREK